MNFAATGLVCLFLVTLSELHSSGNSSVVQQGCEAMRSPPGEMFQNGPATNVPRPAASAGADAYKTIMARNIFGLTPSDPNPSSPKVPVEPVLLRRDLIMNGLFKVGAISCALFVITDAGKPAEKFCLSEGEQNDWLELKRVNAITGSATIFLKQPVMRIQHARSEVVLSIETVKN
ncbi:MAG: hypothetical protein P4N60_02240 [Verrucomicrobiae bacterium]|nr:hypothetical protein [Verrucomicrobiae bacterium]